MKFGIVVLEENFHIAKELGFDYVEPHLQVIANENDEAYEKTKKTLRDLDLAVEACCGFFPGTIKIVGNEVNFDEIAAYAEKALTRAEELGAKVCVIGSGKSRSIPEGFSKKEAFEQFAKVLDLCGNIAKKHGITIVIEPLNQGETTLINTVAEGIELCRFVNNDNVKVLADYFHMFKSGETLEAVENAGDMLAHAHLARANNDRAMPVKGVDDESIKKFADALKKCGYNKRLTLEGWFTEGHIPEAIHAMGDLLDLFKF